MIFRKATSHAFSKWKIQGQIREIQKIQALINNLFGKSGKEENAGNGGDATKEANVKNCRK